MKSSIHIKIAVLALLTLTTGWWGCAGGKKEEALSAPAVAIADSGMAKTEDTAVVTAAVPEEVKGEGLEEEYECRSGDAECRDYIECKDYEWCLSYENDGGAFYFNGTVFNTRINTDASVRAAPSTDGEALFTAKKGTKVQVLGISGDGWSFVSFGKGLFKRGWVYGRYVELGHGRDFSAVKTGEIKIIDFNFTAEDSSTADLTATYEVNNAKKTLKFSAFKAKGQNFLTFFCDIYTGGLHYTAMPGIYTWNFAENQLRHEVLLTREPYMFYNADLLLWQTVRFSNDKNFFFVGDITEYGVQLVFRAINMKLLFGWGYYGGCQNFLTFGFEDTTVTVACPPDTVVAQNYANIEEMDSTILAYGEEYRTNNPPDKYINNMETLCEVNLETGTRKITGARWMYCE